MTSSQLTRTHQDLHRSHAGYQGVPLLHSQANDDMGESNGGTAFRRKRLRQCIAIRELDLHFLLRVGCIVHDEIYNKCINLKEIVLVLS